MMTKKKWFCGVVIFIVVAMLVTGCLAIAAEYGSKEDPLVTLSYINEILSPETMKIVDSILEEKVKGIESKIDEKIAEYSSETDRKLSAFETDSAQSIIDADFVRAVADIVASKSSESAVTEQSCTWSVVKAGKGEIIRLALGSEAVVRAGTAKCYASGSPGMINLSDGSTVADSNTLKINNLYLVTVNENRGIKAVTDITVLVSGSYTIE